MVVAEQGGDVAEPPQTLPEGLIDWNKIHHPPLDATLSPPPKTPWSMVAIRNHKDHGYSNPPIVFPPINHENLHNFPDPPATPEQIPRIHTDNRQISCSDSDSDTNFDSDSNSSSTFSPSDSSPVPRSPLISTLRQIPAAEAVGWFDSWTEILRSKVKRLVWFLCSSFTSSRGVLVTFRSAALTAVLLAFLYFRRRRRLRDRGENTNLLIGIIKERDQKINQLLDQISRMNQMLLALHRVPTSPTT